MALICGNKVNGWISLSGRSRHLGEKLGVHQSEHVVVLIGHQRRVKGDCSQSLLARFDEVGVEYDMKSRIFDGDIEDLCLLRKGALHMDHL
jgi:hypothetical protein